ncbi:MAG: hypothetical protein LW808_000805 [Verrucomicrobiota bacterium]|nr:MAG: hypothetical protein LW808_000805 [Verrucomicrobiota bacterium]
MVRWCGWVLWVVIGVIGVRSVYEVYVYYRQVADLEAAREQQYQEEQEAVAIQEEHVRALREDLEFREHVAREQLQSVHEDELLFRFE